MVFYNCIWIKYKMLEQCTTHCCIKVTEPVRKSCHDGENTYDKLKDSRGTLQKTVHTINDTSFRNEDFEQVSHYSS